MPWRETRGTPPARTCTSWKLSPSSASTRSRSRWEVEARDKGGQQDEISKRQKEIIAATWNSIRDRSKSSSQRAEDGKFLSGVQSCAGRAGSVAGAPHAQPRAFADEPGIPELCPRYGRGVQGHDRGRPGKLKSLDWNGALPPEQRALQHILRAEATRRQIQVAFGRQGGGGARRRRGSQRDLENLFDLELDTEKNQYETGQSASTAEQRNREIDEAVQKLQQLARRQEELAQRQQQNRSQSFEQRWQQEMLRREAEKLQRQMEQLAQNGSSQQRSSSSSSSQGQSGSQSQQGQQGQQSSQAGRQQQQQQQQRRASIDPRLDRALEQLRRATEDMRNSASQQGQQEGAEEMRTAGAPPNASTKP